MSALEVELRGYLLCAHKLSARSPCVTVLEGVGGNYLEGRILMMETGRAWWVIFVQRKLQLCRGYGIRNELGPLEAWGRCSFALDQGWGG